MPPVSPGDSPRSARGSDPGSFLITASALGLRAWEILQEPLKSRISVSYSPKALLYTSPDGLQSRVFWGLVLWYSANRLEHPLPGSLERTSAFKKKYPTDNVKEMPVVPQKQMSRYAGKP